MNTVMAQALAPFIPAPKPTWLTPFCPHGMVEIYWPVNPGLTLTCHLEHEPAERGSRERGTGLQLEQDHPEGLTLHSAWVRDKDVLGLLSDEQVASIEALALAGAAQ